MTKHILEKLTAADAPSAVIDKLRWRPHFRQAYAFDGKKPGEFARFGAFAATAIECATATRKTVDFVASAIERTKRHAA